MEYFLWMLRVFQWAEELISPLQGTLDFDISAVNDSAVKIIPRVISVRGVSSTIANGISIVDVALLGE